MLIRRGLLFFQSWKSQVPLANMGSRVTLILQDFSNRPFPQE